MNENSPVVERVYYRPELDVLRLVAFMLVFFHHVFPRDYVSYLNHFSDVPAHAIAAVSNAFGFGLCLFFFLSAFLISTLLLKELQKTKKIHVKAFYVRRILRIWPLYVFALVIGVIWGHFDPEPEQGKMFAYYAGFVGNWFFQSHQWAQNPITPLWSISVEEQFYVLFPLVVSIVGLRFVKAGGCAIIVISLLSLMWEGSNHAAIDTAIWSNALCQAIFFGGGIILSVLLLHKKVTLRGFTRLIFITMAGFLMFIAAFFTEAKRISFASSGINVASGYILVCISCALLVTAFLDCRIRFPKFLIHLGKISFGLYVFHEIGTILSVKLFTHVFHFTDDQVSHTFLMPLFRMLSLPLTVIFAMISYNFLELPFLKLRKRFTFIENRPA